MTEIDPVLCDPFGVQAIEVWLGFLGAFAAIIVYRFLAWGLHEIGEALEGINRTRGKDRIKWRNIQ